MSVSQTATSAEFQTWALAVADVGTWRCSLTDGWVRGDAVMADMYGFMDNEVQNGVSYERLRQIIHPDDRHIFDRKNELVRETGGHVVMEFRIMPHPGITRWIIVRGRYDISEGPSGEITGHGIVIDITATKTREYENGESFYASSNTMRAGSNTLYNVADSAIALRQAIDRLTSEEIPGLSEATDIALRLIGHHLARQTKVD